ncbi:LOW QUALITY PROTEIN: xanthine dehydrogenase/oxidase [Sceloporus undulatus]|uniref:LOW QUALITY PROTEIN: xanthine dehydrogenase/oxidase n=1 Tax=Sceloporus undulatus TaxID=8520 RepID=UPI001C4A9A84|nr:LOW QUALITY PROTEIN: xanthine dehydrogenase/oxidase [Sceloporus undulatus]
MASEKKDELVFFVNGKKVVEKNVDPETTLLTYLRRKLGLCGTKLGCGEGGCGACTVMISRFDNFQKKIIHYSANACLFPLCALHHVAVTTVEGIGSTKTRLHPVQERIAKSHGSQCGFCTPGIVMSMYTLLRNQPQPKMEEIEDAFQGNLCRCTGYRPILEGYRTFAKDWECCRRNVNGLGCCMARKENAMDQGCGKKIVNGSSCCMNGKEDNTELISSALFSPSEFQPLDPTQEPIFPPELLTHNNKPREQLCFKGDRVMWFQPSTLKELVSLKAQYPSAKLVVGNTEVGIEMRLKNMLYPVIIAPTWIPEMNSVQHTEEGISFGASCTLSHIEEVLRKAVAQLPSYKTEVFQAVLEQLRWFAGPQIRNVAALGGNIMTASPISDLNPVFMASGSKLTLISNEGSRTIKMDETFFTGYRKTVLKPQEILLSVEIPFSRKGEYFSAFKQASRREDDIAIVTCGMRVLFQEGTNHVQEIKLSYGGMAPTTVLAGKTCQELIGREWKEDILQEACHMLASEMNLSPSAPGGMVDFRRTLVLSFFFKFYLTVLQKLNIELNGNNNLGEMVPPRYASATELFHKDPVDNVQLFQEVPPGQTIEDTVGRPLMHLSAAKQASGEAVYCDDIPHYENELYLTLVTSTKAHAKILSVDTTEAQNVPGFVCFISEKDVPGSNVTGIANDETIFAKDTVTCVGHIIGGILADTQEHSRRAARAVKITYEDLTPIVTIEEAIEKQSFFNWVRKIEKGNIQKGFEEADHILEGEMYLGGQEHFYLETHCTIAVPKKEDGEMELFVSTQNLTKTQEFVANALGVPSNRIVVRVKRMGGGFGGKETRSTIVSTAVAVAAVKMGRPVRCMLDRDEDMLISGGRHPFLGQYKVGFKKNGRITSLDVLYYSNGGNSADLSFGVMDRAVLHMDNSYNIPNIRGIGKVCKTNLSSNTAFRGFGGPQGMMVAECWMSDIALKCGLPAEEVRKLNLYNEGDLTHFNQKLEGFTLRRCWEECLKNSDYHSRRKLIDEYNRQNRWKKRGMAIIPTKFGISFTIPFLNQAGALVHVYTDGTVLLTHGGTEMGQGLHTKMIQVASRTLGIPTSKIYISETSTNTVPNASPTAASVSADINGMAVLNACQTIVKRLEPIKSANPKGSWEDWVLAAYQDCVSLSATGFYRIPDLDYDPEKNEGNAFAYFSYGVACSEVEIDCLTGDHKNLRTDIVMDVGTSLNPAIDIGQIEGAFVQGVGLFTLEELRYSPEGNLYTRGPGMYKIPAFGDIPTEFHVSLLRDCPNKKAIYSSKAVGEPPLFLSASVFYAIKDAIIAARQESGLKDPFRLDSPATPERIRNACVDVFTKMCPSAKPGTFKPWSVRV